MAIGSFRDKRTAAIADGGEPRGIAPELAKLTRRKLAMLVAADRVQDLRAPPGNRLESLRGDRDGQYSIRVNDQWRLCFRWADGSAEDVELVDYH